MGAGIGTFTFAIDRYAPQSICLYFMLDRSVCGIVGTAPWIHELQPEPSAGTSWTAGRIEERQLNFRNNIDGWLSIRRALLDGTDVR